MEHLGKPRDGVRGDRLSLTIIGGSSEHDPMSVVSGQITGLCITLGAGHPGRNHCGEMTLGFLLDLHAYIYGLQVFSIPILQLNPYRPSAMFGIAFILAFCTITAAAAPLHPRNNPQGDPCAALIGVRGCKFLT